MGVSEEPPELLPIRAINESVYCARLFFIEHVERQFEDSHDTLDGKRIHETVDEARGLLDAARQAYSVTSVELTSTRLGIIGKLDLVRGDGNLATPIDFKRGRLPPADIGVYEPERIQAILQALLLRDNGFNCTEARVYYAKSKTAVSVLIDTNAEEQAHNAIERAREIVRRATLPPPLIDSPKCPGCSLNAICLPDETNMLRDAASRVVRPFAAPRDDAKPVYVTKAGSRVGLSGEVLQVRYDDKVVGEARLIETDSVALFGNVQMSSQAYRAILDRDIPAFFLSFGGWLYGYARSIDDHSLDLRVAQHRCEEELALAISRSIVEGKVRNQRTMIRRLSRTDAKRTLQALAIIIVRVTRAKSREELLGLEGRAARLYFERFAGLLNNEVFDFRNRSRRPPADSVNAMLSFGYAMLTKEALAAVISVGFEPALGFYHQLRPGRPSLALDLIEEFRPLVVDSTVLSLINTREIKPTHFIKRGIGVNLTDEGRKIFIQALERRFASTITHPIFGYETSYRRAMWIQARLLARTVQGELPRYTAFLTR